MAAEGGEVTSLLQKIETHCAGEGRMLPGKNFSMADLWAFFFLNFMRCGFWCAS